MPITDAQRRAVYKYKAENIKRVPLEMQNSEYAALKAAADAVGKPVNRYIKDAIAEVMARDAVTPAQAAETPSERVSTSGGASVPPTPEGRENAAS